MKCIVTHGPRIGRKVIANGIAPLDAVRLIESKIGRKIPFKRDKKAIACGQLLGYSVGASSDNDIYWVQREAIL